MTTECRDRLHECLCAAIVPWCLCTSPRCSSAGDGRGPSSWWGQRSASRRSCVGRGRTACTRTGSPPPRSPCWTLRQGLSCQRSHVLSRGFSKWKRGAGLPLGPEELRWAPEARVHVQQVNRNAHQGVFGDGEAVNLGGFLAHPLEPRRGGDQTLWLQKDLVKVLQTEQVLVADRSLRTEEKRGAGQQDVQCQLLKGLLSMATNHMMKIHFSRCWHRFLPAGSAWHQGWWPGCRGGKWEWCWWSQSRQRWKLKPEKGSRAQSNLRQNKKC